MQANGLFAGYAAEDYGLRHRPLDAGTTGERLHELLLTPTPNPSPNPNAILLLPLIRRAARELALHRGARPWSEAHS